MLGQPVEGIHRARGEEAEVETLLGRPRYAAAAAVAAEEAGRE